MGLKDNPERFHGLLKRLGKAAVALVASAATLAGGMLVAGTAQAAAGPGYYANPMSGSAAGGWWVGTGSFFLGPQDDSKPYKYCVEFSNPYDWQNQGTWTPVDTDDGKKAAYLVDKYQNDGDALTQAALAYAIHDHFDRNQAWWNEAKTKMTLVGGDINAVRNRAATIWAEANDMPSTIQASYRYMQGKRKGTFDPGIKTGDGRWVAGATYTITDLNKVAKFDGSNDYTITGTTTGAEEHLPWTATGNGKTNFQITRKIPRVAVSNSSSQDLLKPTDPETQSANIQFEVRRDFQPTVTTEVNSRELKRGETVQDKSTKDPLHNVTGPFIWR
ncbi:cell surface protein [Bifidobacterium saguini DSM 23967]|uniref:Cell surface protein n=2 Tax=Bifidobacterium saguini TaxID=762210 RepID=A0A087DCC0_9BIFI|nr:hypothetical protein [Bifidobacterium saguini]KFI93170.1 cell surface protein [Bifidobacterium saguini DSM 23967]QTB91213.1 hypothetical protein BSD967_01855 [Bifidobacterium saguini]